MRRMASHTPITIKMSGQSCPIQWKENTPRLSSKSSTPIAIRIIAPKGTPATVAGPQAPRASGESGGAVGTADICEASADATLADTGGGGCVTATIGGAP